MYELYSRKRFPKNNSVNSVPEPPIAVAARSKARTVFARSNAGIMVSNLTKGVDVFVRLFCVCVVLCVGSGLVTSWSPVQGVLSSLYKNKKLKSGQGPTKGL
jgi:hypothetical protein